MENEMTTLKALEAIKAFAPAAVYLEKLTQGTVNGNFDVQAEERKAGGDVDAKEIAKSWKVRTNAGKLHKLLVSMNTVAEAHYAWEMKQKAIPASIIRDQKEIAAPVKA